MKRLDSMDLASLDPLCSNPILTCTKDWRIFLYVRCSLASRDASVAALASVGGSSSFPRQILGLHPREKPSMDSNDGCLRISERCFPRAHPHPAGCTVTTLITVLWVGYARYGFGFASDSIASKRRFFRRASARLRRWRSALRACHVPVDACCRPWRPQDAPTPVLRPSWPLRAWFDTCGRRACGHGCNVLRSWRSWRSCRC